MKVIIERLGGFFDEVDLGPVGGCLGDGGEGGVRRQVEVGVEAGGGGVSGEGDGGILAGGILAGGILASAESWLA